MSRQVAKSFERRYHASWMAKNGSSPLAKLGRWMVEHRSRRAGAPRDLVIAAEVDVSTRLPLVAAREPTRRHRKHFAWLLTWHLRLNEVIGVTS